ncbi:MAG: lysophospholipase [Proteobacteria bacterium]|nr:lysophospholipase [Pseudomonadota bacterium]
MPTQLSFWKDDTGGSRAAEGEDLGERDRILATRGGARIRQGVVDTGRTVRFRRWLHEVATGDGKDLVMTRKRPVGRPVVGAVMLVHGLGQNRWSWTLPQRSLENYLVSQGFETYNVELRGHGLSGALGSPVPRTFEDYVQWDVPALIEAVSILWGKGRVFYVGHSLGGSLSYCLGPEHQEKLAGIVSIAGPLHMGRGNHIIQNAARLGYVAGRMVRVPEKYLPTTLHVDHMGFLIRQALFFLDHKQNRLPLQLWHPRSMEREILMERLSRGMDRTGFSMVRFLVDWAGTGRFKSSCGSVDFEAPLADLSVPLLFINGDRDYAVPPSASLGAFQQAKSPDKTFEVFGKKTTGKHFGHLDLIYGRHAPQTVWPCLADWMKERAG